MENLFFSTVYNNFEQAIIKLLLFIAISGFLLYLLFFIFSKMLFKKNKYRKEISLRLTFLWSLFAFFILFNIYVFVLFYKIGVDNMDFTKGIFYLGILSQILLYVSILIFFYIKRHALKKLINENILN